MNSRRSKGFSLLEVTVAIGILTGLTSLGLSMATQAIRSVEKMRSLGSLEAEHAAVRELAFGIPITDALNVACDGHPYQRFQAVAGGGGGCVPLSSPATAAQKNTLNTLRNVVFRWPEAGVFQNGQINPLLDQAYFNAQVAPALANAGCISCHNGGAITGALHPNITGRNFSIYSQLAQPAAGGGAGLAALPVVSRAMLGSLLGRKLLTRQFQMSGVLAGAKLVTGAAGLSRVVTHAVSFLPVDPAVFGSTVRGPLFASQSGFVDNAANVAAWAFVCPGPCNAGEVSEPSTCVSNIFEDVPCPKPKKCPGMTYTVTRTWNCIAYQDYDNRKGINVRVSTSQLDRFSLQNRYLSTEGTLQ